MSRIGKQAITLPGKVTVKLDGQKISVDGPKGSLSRILPSLVCCTLDEGKQALFIDKTQDTKLSQALYGLSRTLVANMVTGVSTGFQKKLEITGVGYRAQLDGKDLVLKVHNKKNSANSYEEPVGTANADFVFNFKIENLKIVPGDYDVAVSSKSISHFKNKVKPIEYWIALEPDSKINK